MFFIFFSPFVMRMKKKKKKKQKTNLQLSRANGHRAKTAENQSSTPLFALIALIFRLSFRRNKEEFKPKGTLVIYVFVRFSSRVVVVVVVVVFVVDVVVVVVDVFLSFSSSLFRCVLASL